MTALGVVLLGAVWLTQSERGRAELADFGLTQLNAILPGTIHVDHVAELGLRAVELRGVRVEDPTGAEVIAVDRVRAELRPRSALAGEIVVSDVIISDVRVDLRQLGEKRRGLIAAFVDPDAPESPPSGSVPPHVRVLHATLTGGSARLPEVAALGQLDLTTIQIEGAYELRDGESLVDLKKLACAVERGGERLAQLERVAGRLPAEPEPISISLEARVLQSKLVLEARGAAPWQSAGDRAPVQAKLELRDVWPMELAARLQPAVQLPELTGPFAAALTLQGSLRELQAKLALQTAGGNAQLAANLRDYEHATWIFDSAGLDPTRVVSGLGLPQPLVLGARVAGTLELPADGSIAASIDADLRLNGHPLPRTGASARLLDGALHDVKLTLADAYSKVALNGELAADRALHAGLTLKLDARTVREALRAWGREIPEARGVISGRLELEHAATTRISGHIEGEEFECGPLSLREFAVLADLRGRPPALSGSAELRLGSGKLSDLELRDIAFSIAGGPSHWALTTAATLPDRASMALQLAVRELSERGVTFSGAGEGKLAGESWRLDLLQTRAQASGRVDTQGVTVRVGGQVLSARGHWAAAQSDIALNARALDLARLQALAKRLAPDAVAALPALRGLVGFEATLSGSVSRPHVALKLDADRLGTLGSANVDLQLNGSLDATAGSARLEAQVDDSDGSGLRSKLLAESQFARAADWLNSLIAGQHRLGVELAGLDLDWLAAASGIAMPVHGRFEGQLNASLDTTLGLDWRASGSVRSDADPGKLALAHTLSLGESGAHTTLRAGADANPLLTLEASLDVPLVREQLRSLVARARSLALTQAWSLELEVLPRDIRKLPLRSLLSSAELPALKLGLHTAIDHQPDAEPSVHLAVIGDQLKAFEENSGCKPELLSASLDAELRAGKLTASLSSRQGRKHLLTSELTAGFSLAKLLAGERVKPTDVELSARVEGAELATLPQVCRQARGRVDLDLVVSEPFEDKPKVKANLQVHDLTLANDTLSLRAELEANPSSASMQAELQAAGKVSKLNASIPLRWSGGTLSLDHTHELSASLKLDALPIAPFLPAASGLSYASGNIGGQVSVRGTLADPQVSGRLELHEVAFTLTDLAQPIDNVRGSLRFDGRRIAIEKLTAQDKQGKLELSADATLKSRDEASGKLHLVLDKFPVRQNGEVAATVQGDFSVAAEVTPALAHVKLKIDQFDTYLESIKSSGGLSLQPHPDLTVNGVPNNKPKPAAKAEEPKAEHATQRPFRLDIQSTRFWIKRDDFAMRLSADLSATWKNGEPKFTGEILVERGYVDLLGKQFEINTNESKLTFSGDSGTPDPIVSIRAHHDNRKTGDVIGVRISGRSSAPELVFTVNDKKVEAGAAVAAIYGSQQYDPHAQQTATVQASAVLSGLTAGLLATAARRNLGALAPMLMIDPADEDSGASVRAGFEFDSLVPGPLRDIITGVYVEGIVSSGKQGDSEHSEKDSLRPGALLELYFPYNLFTAGQYGPGTTWSIDVGWQL